MDRTLGENVKRLREQRAWTQEHLAHVAGITARTVQRIEQGDPASADSLMGLAQALDVSLDDLRRSPADEAAAHAVAELKKIEERYVIVRLDRIQRASSLTACLSGADAFQVDRVELNNDDEEDAVAEIDGFLRDGIDGWSECGASERRELERDLQRMIENLHSLGFVVAAGQRQSRLRSDAAAAARDSVPFTIMYVMISRAKDPKLFIAVAKNAPVQLV